jgi:hypothetical protein
MWIDEETKRIALGVSDSNTFGNRMLGNFGKARARSRLLSAPKHRALRRNRWGHVGAMENIPLDVREVPLQ